MPLSPATIDAMLAAGLTAEQMGAIIKAELVAGEAKDAAVDEARKAKAREGNRERQARWRQRNARNADNAVTDRDERDPPPKIYNSTPHHDSPADPDGSAAPKGAGGDEASGEAGSGGAAAVGGKTAATPRARRIPADFASSPEARTVCAEMGLNEAEAAEALAEFCDFWMAEGGAKARKIDWARTLRNRLRELGRRRPQARAGPGRPRYSNGFFDLIRDDMAGPDDRRADPQRQPLRIASSGRQ